MIASNLKKKVYLHKFLGTVCLTIFFAIISWINLWLVCSIEVRAGQCAGEAQDMG